MEIRRAAVTAYLFKYLNEFKNEVFREKIYVTKNRQGMAVFRHYWLRISFYLARSSEGYAIKKQLLLDYRWFFEAPNR